jgi:DNA-binding NarL/FixJ family response regulator
MEADVAKAITVVLADHHVVFADGLRVILDAEDDLAVLAVAHDDGQAVTSAARHRPAVVVLDAHLPVGRLDQTLAAVRAASPTTRLLVLSGASDPEMTAAVLACGADASSTKDCSSRQVATLIRQLAFDEQPVVPRATSFRPGRDPMVELRLQTLSGRERELLGLVAIGWSSRRIATHWRVSYLTVRSHMQNLLFKLGVRSQLAAALFAIEHGVVGHYGCCLQPWRPAAS